MIRSELNRELHDIGITINEAIEMSSPLHGFVNVTNNIRLASRFVQDKMTVANIHYGYYDDGDDGYFVRHRTDGPSELFFDATGRIDTMYFEIHDNNITDIDFTLLNWPFTKDEELLFMIKHG